METHGRRLRVLAAIPLAALVGSLAAGHAQAAPFTLVASDDVEIDLEQPDRNLHDSGVEFESDATDQSNKLSLVPGTAGPTEPPSTNARAEALIFRWSSLGTLAGYTVTGPGTFTVANNFTLNLAGNSANFGDYTVHEITGGTASWAETTVTANILLDGESSLTNIIGPALDTGQSGVSADGTVSADNTLSIAADVIQRLIDGTSSGLLIQGVGATNFSLLSHSSPNSANHPVLEFDAEVPEPASLGLLGVGGLALLRRRRRA